MRGSAEYELTSELDARVSRIASKEVSKLPGRSKLSGIHLGANAGRARNSPERRRSRPAIILRQANEGHETCLRFQPNPVVWFLAFHWNSPAHFGHASRRLLAVLRVEVAALACF